MIYVYLCVGAFVGLLVLYFALTAREVRKKREKEAREKEMLEIMRKQNQPQINT